MNKPIAFVTGSSRGIGKAIALALAKEGYDIWIHYNKNARLATDVLDEITSYGSNGRLIQLDLNNSGQIYDCINPLIEMESPEIFIHNAGILATAPIALMSADQIKSIFMVNLESFFHLVKLVSRKMIQVKKGRVISISSIAGVKGIAGQACYSASKAGLIAATYALARELGPYNILVNTLVPGLIETEMSCSHSQQVINQIPVRRAGLPREIADIVCFLCSDKASFINGSVIPITGGL